MLTSAVFVRTILLLLNVAGRLARGTLASEGAAAVVAFASQLMGSVNVTISLKRGVWDVGAESSCMLSIRGKMESRMTCRDSKQPAMLSHDGGC